MQRILTVAALALLLAWGACAARRALASDETQIRWLIEDAVEAFNAGRPGSAVAPFADDWHDRTRGIHKDTLHQVLAHTMLQERGAGGFLWEVSVPDESLVIEIGDGSATAALEALFARRTDGALQVRWHIAVEAELRDGEGGWRIFRTKHATLAGSPH